MYLMFVNTPVLYFDFDDFIVEVINEQFLPYSLQGKFVKSVNPKDLLRNIQYLKSWLSRRVLSLSRANAKQIYTMYQIPQLDDIETRVKICLACKGVVEMVQYDKKVFGVQWHPEIDFDKSQLSQYLFKQFFNC